MAKKIIPKTADEKKARLKKYLDNFKTMSKEEANKELAGLTKSALNAEYMAAYIMAYSNDADKKWYNDVFKKILTTKKEIQRTNKDGDTATVELKYDIQAVRKAFIDHFGITTKEPKEYDFDPFADIDF